MKNRKVILLMALLSTTLSIQAQSFIKSIHTEEDEFAYSAIETPEGGYLVYLVKGAFSYADEGRVSHRDIILKLDAWGNELDSLVLNDSDSLEFQISGLLKYQDEFIIWGSNYKATNLDYPVSVQIVRMDYDFSLKHDTTLQFKDNYIFPGNMIINSQNHLMMPGTLISEDFTTLHSICEELTIDGTLIRLKQYDEPQPCQGIIEIPQNHCFNLIDVNRIVQIDSSLNYVKTLYSVPTMLYENTLFNMFISKLVDSSSYLVEGCVMKSDGTRNGAWGLFNNGVWDTVVNFGSVDTNDYSAGLDFISPQHIYSALSHPSRPPADPNFDMTDTQMLLYSIQINATVNWNLRYGGLGYLLSGKPLATSDGGCLWIGNYWDWHHKTNLDYDVIILKINADGTLITGENEPEQFQRNISLFPNPGKEFHINTNLTDYAVCIVNTFGQNVLVVNNLTGNCVLATDKIPPGTYFYKVLSTGKIIVTGKWVKL